MVDDHSRDRGARPSLSSNGEVHGSGAGAGGGNPGEDYDDDAAGGGGDLGGKRDASVGQEQRIDQAVENQSSVTPEDYPEPAAMPTKSDD